MRAWPVGGCHFEMCSGTEAGSYLRLIDSCITQLKAQGHSRTCNASKEEEEEKSLGSEISSFTAQRVFTLDRVRPALGDCELGQ